MSTYTGYKFKTKTCACTGFMVESIVISHAVQNNCINNRFITRFVYIFTVNLFLNEKSYTSV